MKAKSWLFIFFITISSRSLAWGNRGHDALTVVATRIAAEKYPDPKFYAPLFSRTEMLAHLANIPDIYWKSLPKEERKALDTAHYIDLELFDEGLVSSKIPVSVSEALIRARKSCKVKEKNSSLDCVGNSTLRDIMLVTGSAPWRIEQLVDAMVEQLTLAKSLESKAGSEQEFTKAVDQALLYAGLMSHFIGDLAQPLHASDDYDGYGAGSGGLHYYFEDLLVDQLNFGFYDEVKTEALKNKPVASFLKFIPNSNDFKPATWSYALAIHSHKTLPELFSLDRRYAIIKASSSDKGLNIPARRKEASQAVKGFRPFLKKRMAAGADMLAFMWHQAWIKSGSPDLSQYKSYFFPLKPEAISLSYLGDK